MVELRSKSTRSALRKQMIHAQLGISRRNDSTFCSKRTYEDGLQWTIGSSPEQERKRRKKTSFDDLSIELRELILKYLSLPDFHNARLAGLGCNDVSFRLRMKSIMGERIGKLEEFLTECTTSNTFNSLKRRKLYMTPTEIVKNTRGYVSFQTCSFIPEGITEIRNVTELYLYPAKKAKYAHICNAPSTVTSSVTSSVYGLTHIPRCILALDKLQRLDLTNNSRLEYLPEDIGYCLPNLMYICLRGCPLIKSLPESLFRVLESNTKRYRKGTSSFHDIMLYEDKVLVRSYFETTITKDKYPRLAAFIHDL